MDGPDETLQLDDNDIMTIAKQLCSQLTTLNNKGFLHNDLHLGNFMLKKTAQNEITTKLIDYDRALKIGEFEDDKGRQLNIPGYDNILENALSQENYQKFLKTANYFTSKDKEAGILFGELQKLIKNPENKSKLRDLIIDNYLLNEPPNKYIPDSSDTKKINALKNQDVLYLNTNQNISNLKKLIKAKHHFRKIVKTSSIHNIVSKTFIVYPYKNFFGIKSNNLQNVIIIDENGNEQKLIYDIQQNEFYTKTFFSKQIYKLNITTEHTSPSPKNQASFKHEAPKIKQAPEMPPEQPVKDTPTPSR